MAIPVTTAKWDADAVLVRWLTTIRHMYSMLPWAHQSAAVRAVERAVEAGVRHVLISMPSGSGKTLTALFVVDRLLQQRRASGVLYLVDRKSRVEQLRQAATTLVTSSGLPLVDAYPILERKAVDSLADTAGKSQFVWVATTADLQHVTMQLPSDLVDLVVYEGSDDPGARLQTIAEYFHATTVNFGPQVWPDELLAFVYSPEQAVQEGVLVEHESAKPRRFADTESIRPQEGDRVFMLFADSDRREVTEIASILRISGFEVQASTELAEIDGGDTLVIFLSPDSIATLALDSLDKVIDRRGAELLPAVLKPCSIPRSLADRGVVDVTAGADPLVRALRWSNRVNLTTLGPDAFERLVADLLSRIGFTDLKAPFEVDDSGFDFLGVYQDTLGLADPATYAVEVKYGSAGRLSIRDLQRFASRTEPRVLVVTNVQLTRLAEDVLRQLQHEGKNIQVFDGLRIKNLLQSYPDLVSSHFRADRASR